MVLWCTEMVRQDEKYKHVILCQNKYSVWALKPNRVNFPDFLMFQRRLCNVSTKSGVTLPVKINCFRKTVGKKFLSTETADEFHVFIIKTYFKSHDIALVSQWKFILHCFWAYCVMEIICNEHFLRIPLKKPFFKGLHKD